MCISNTAKIIQLIITDWGNMRRTWQHGYLDHCFIPHLSTQLGAVTHRWIQLQHQMYFYETLLILVLEIRFNFQIDVQCAEKAISKINFHIWWNLEQIWHSWHQRVPEQRGLSGLLSVIRLGLPHGQGWGDFLSSGHPPQLNTLRPRQHGCHFAVATFKRIFLNGNFIISLKMSLKFVPKGPINNIPALVQTMAWCRPGDKPLSEPMMVTWLTHICVTCPQWVNSVGSGVDWVIGLFSLWKDLLPAGC